MNISMKLLENVAVDQKVLATNLPDMPDCTGAGLDIKTEIINRFPLVDWLRNTSLTQRVRRDMRESGLNLVHKDCETDKWVIETPREMWTELPESTENECCWQPFNFAKCGGNVPLNLLCLKDCDNIMDDLIGRNITFGTDVAGFAGRNETLRDVKRRVARMSMAFLTAQNIILGSDNVFTDVLKPFHGLIQVMENPAIAVVNGTNILSAFDSVACRLALLGGGTYVFAMNPVIYQGLLNEIRRGQYGDLPTGWSREGDVLRFRNMALIQDRLVPVDFESGTGEIWLLNSEAVGLYLATDLMPADAYIRESKSITTYEEGCSEECTYYYNLGAVLANNANKLIRIVDVPISGACSAAIGDLSTLIQPKTLIPSV